MAARTAADGKWVRRCAENCADGCGQRGCNGAAGNGWGGKAAADERTAADRVGAREWLEMGGEKKPLVMSELGCADGCGWEMGSENCADGCGRRGCNRVAGNGWGEEAAGDEPAWLRGRLRTANGWGELRGRLRTACTGAREWLEMGGEKKPLGMSELGCADGCGREMGAVNCADGCGRRGCNGVVGNGWGEEAAGDERAWLRGRLRTANGLGELRGRLRTAWVQGSGWKWVGRRSRWRSASLAARTAADGTWLRRIARTAADGVGAREWLEMGGEKNPLEISELGCADGRLRTACVPGSGWKCVGRKSRW